MFLPVTALSRSLGACEGKACVLLHYTTAVMPEARRENKRG